RAKNIAFDGISSDVSPSVDDQAIRSGTFCSSNATFSVSSACFVSYNEILNSYITRMTTINIPTITKNPVWAYNTFFKSLKINRHPKSTSDKVTHGVINHPHANVISVSKFISEITQTSTQAKVIFNGVSFTNS